VQGDEVRGPAAPRITVALYGTAPLHRVQVRRGLECVHTWPDPQQVLALAPAERRLAIIWSGVRVRERSKKARWDGSLVIAGGAIRKVQPFAFDRPDEGVTRLSNQALTWRSTTSGDPDGVILEVDGDDRTQLRFASGPVTFSFRLGEVGAAGLSVPAGGVNLQVQVYWTPAAPGPKDLTFTFQDPAPLPGATNAYWVRALQADGHLAWSSPLFFDCEPGA
jgi:hypothetical protein